MSVELLVLADRPALARHAAGELLVGIAHAQAARGNAGIVLTGGSAGIAVLAALAEHPERGIVDWKAVDFWWGDERFLPDGDPERNETQARLALLDHVPVDPARVHAMPASDGPDGPKVELAAARYNAQLALAGQAQGLPVPRFDVLLLGVGPDAHIASLFPGLLALQERERLAIGVHNSPKPPAERISLTFPAIQSATEVWCLVAGSDKAAAVRLSLNEAELSAAPAAGAQGRERTRWFVDEAAAALVPAELR